MASPKKFLRESGNYWVLAEYGSKSNPTAKPHEVRTSKNDGKTYCTCLGWIHKARKGDGVCKHIAAFKSKEPAEAVTVYSFDEFVKVKRALAIVTDTAPVVAETKVRRK